MSRRRHEGDRRSNYPASNGGGRFSFARLLMYNILFCPSSHVQCPMVCAGLDPLSMMRAAPSMPRRASPRRGPCAAVRRAPAHRPRPGPPARARAALRRHSDACARAPGRVAPPGKASDDSCRGPGSAALASGGTKPSAPSPPEGCASRPCRRRRRGPLASTPRGRAAARPRPAAPRLPAAGGGPCNHLHAHLRERASERADCMRTLASGRAS